LRQHLDDDVVGDAARVDQPADEIIFGGARSRKTDLDLLETHLEQEVEEAALLFGAHRIDERLVTVAQVG